MSSEKFDITKCLGEVGKYHGVNEICSTLPGTSHSYIHLSILLAHFLSYFNDSMTYSVIHHDMSY